MKSKNTPCIFLKTLFFFFCLVTSFSAIADDKMGDFSLPDLSGSPVSLSKYLGKKTMVINFWASWCDSCAEEIGKLNTLKKQYEGSSIAFIGINAGETPDKVSRFLNKTSFGFEILLDQDKKIAKQLGILSLPQTLIVNKAGVISYKKSTPPTEINLE